MAAFAMCPQCLAEYGDPADRRFHAQPIACPRCGPGLELLDAGGRRLAERQEALEMAARLVLEGRVLALKGLGGFQLVVDAVNEAAVVLLRMRKRRPTRPFAVMLADLDEVRRLCETSDDEARALASPEAPILLLRRRGGGLAESVAPGNPRLGVMLPYTPLHCLLLEAVGRPIVCTSGNLAEEPMAIAIDDAVARLGCGHRRRVAHARSTDRPPGRRLRGAVRRRRIADASPRTGICPAADRPGHLRPDDPRRRRPFEEHGGPGDWRRSAPRGA